MFVSLQGIALASLLQENHTRVQVSFAEDMNAKARSTMEDAHAIVDKLGGDPHTGFFGVYDGHGGEQLQRIQFR